MPFPKFRKLMLFAACLAPNACRHSEPSQVKEFEKIPKSAEASQAIDFKLSLVSDIPQTVTKALPKFSQEEEEEEEEEFLDLDNVEKSFWNVTFGKISAGQFEKLKASYFNNPRLAYNPEREYEIIDFMPPQIQALAGFRSNAEQIASEIPFELEGMPGKSHYYSFESLSDCWNAAYEITRGSSESTSIYYIDSALAQDIFTNPKYSRAFKEYNLNKKWNTPENLFIRNLDAKPFDVMLIYGRAFGAKNVSLQHVAIYIDEDFYFEKTGPDSKLNYRFVRFSEIASVYSEWRDARVEVRRFEGKELPPASEVFSYKGRGQTLPKGFSSKALKTVWPGIMNSVTNFSPSNFEDSQHRSLYLLVDVPLIYDSRTDRYALSRQGFKSSLKSIPIPGAAPLVPLKPAAAP